MKMQEAIHEALKRLDCEPDPGLKAAIAKNINADVISLEVPVWHEETIIHSLMLGIRDASRDEDQSFPA